MNSGSALRTQEIAQSRILVEKVIRRLKTYNILTGELALNMVIHADDIITVVCSAVCNMKVMQQCRNGDKSTGRYIRSYYKR